LRKSGRSVRFSLRAVKTMGWPTTDGLTLEATAVLVPATIMAAEVLPL
jgi:hypothetical protein